MAERAREIVDVVLRDLMGRRGIKVPFFELEDSDPDTFEEMKSELTDRVTEVLDMTETTEVYLESGPLDGQIATIEHTEGEPLPPFVVGEGSLLAGMFYEQHPIPFALVYKHNPQRRHEELRLYEFNEIDFSNRPTGDSGEVITALRVTRG